MASLLPSLSFSLLFLLLSSPPLTVADTGKLGVNYGRIANNLPTPNKVVTLLKSKSLTRVKIFDTDPNILSAFSGSGFSLTVALPNENLSIAASSPSFTDDWIRTRILPVYPSTRISAIAIGNEVNTDSNLTQFLIPAISNLYSSLEKFSVSNSIKISSPFSLSSLQNSYPSSAGSFKSDLVEPVFKPLLNFLRNTSSFLMVNIYPFFAYSANANEISIDYALFRPNPGVVDSGNGLKYGNLFEAQLDAVHAAMGLLGYHDVKVVVTETGWPSKGDENEIGANGPNAEAYNGNLVKRILTGGGTPLRPNDNLEVYLFALFNENLKPGPTSEKNYGLFYPDESEVYNISLTVAEMNGETVNGGGKVAVTVGNTWCVANEEVAEEKLQAGLDYACGEGGADCHAIQPGGTCHHLDSLVARASYAFNSYYQMKARAAGTCHFGGAAHVVTQAPKFGNCKFSTGN